MKLPVLSIRSRIQLWHGLLLACILIVLGIVAWRMQWDNELERVDRELSEVIAQMHVALGTSGLERFALPPEFIVRNRARGCYYAVWSRSDKLITRSNDAPASLEVPKREPAGVIRARWQTLDSRREGYIFTRPGECLLAGISVEAEHAGMTQFGVWLAALGCGVLVMGLVVDAWIVRRAIRPVEEIISAAERISRGNLAARIESGTMSEELKRLTTVLNHTFASLDQAFTQQKRFSGDVAHELRTPVSVLITESQIALERERSSEDYRETIATCLRSARRMAGLIESLLGLAQIESAPGASRAPCDLAALTRDIVDSLRSTAEAQNIKLRAKLDPAPCAANAEQITQVVANLIINAIQHNHRGGNVLIETGLMGDNATLRVENTGAGITAADLPHVFERFYRTDASRNRKTGGVGLGLAISKAITDAHGAELTAESTPGERTIFEMRV
jgi:two-component system, OmpR family, sensor kinase